jgi:hypothetical protein
MKITTDIEIEIQKSSQSSPIDIYPQIVECWNEHEKMWQTDNGRSYIHIIQTKAYNYHLLYLDGRLGIVEKSGTTIFFHLTTKVSKLMSGDLADLNIPMANEDRSLLGFDRLTPDVQQLLRDKYNFPEELRNKLDYRLNGDFVWSAETIKIAQQYNLLKT